MYSYNHIKMGQNLRKTEPRHDKTNKMSVCPAKTDQPGHPPGLISLRCPREESLGPKLPTERTAKTQIRLGGCSG